MWRYQGVSVYMILVLGGLAACGTQGTASPGVGSGSACAAPFTKVSDAIVTPGESVVATATDMWNDCTDSDKVPDVETPDVLPLTAQPIVWQQGSQDSILTTTDANLDGVIETSVMIPTDAQSGPAEIRIGAAEPVTVTVEPQN